MMQLLELCCGTKSISKEFEKAGFETVTVDIEPSFEPTICADIRSLDPHDFIDYDVLWASPPCNAFTVARIGTNWYHDGTPKNDIAKDGLTILNKVIEFIDVIDPKLWWFENPVGKMRVMPQVQRFERKMVTYCQYGDTRMKPTDIWTNTSWIPRPPCKQGASCHERAPRGSRTGTQGLKDSRERAIIPAELCKELAEYAVRYLRGERQQMNGPGQPGLFDR